MKTPPTLTHHMTRFVSATRQRFIRGAFSLIFSFAVPALITGCGQSPGSVSHSLSDDAARASQMLDSGSFEAATQVLHESLTRTKTDASVLCQYVRCLVLSRDPAYPNFMQSPMITDGDYYWAFGIATQAANLAVELDPSCKPYLADVIFQAFEKRAKATFAEGRACIGIPQSMYYPETGRYRIASGLDLTMMNICWEAIKLDPETARVWAPRYKDLMQWAVDRGKVASAMMFGNLYGDMLQGGNGPEDFRKANQAFLDALELYKEDPSHDFLRDTLDAYPVCFRDELLGDPYAVDSMFAKLEDKLKAHSVSIPRPTTETPRNLSFPSGAPPS